MSDRGLTFYEEVVALEQAEKAFVLVTLVDALGSVPQDIGAKMLVTSAGLHTGTIGGGSLRVFPVVTARH